jgi:hypothetical protein
MAGDVKINPAGLRQMARVNEKLMLDIAELTREGAADRSPVAAINGGNNRDSIALKIESPMSMYVHTESGYGGWLEIGTSKMAARPYIRPAYQDAVREASK